MKVYVRNKFVTVGGSSVVLDENKNPIYKVKGKLFSPTRVKYVCNMAGERLYKVRNKFINFFVHRSYVYDANNRQIATVKDKFLNVKQKYYIEGTQDNLRVEGNFFSLTCQILRNECVIGTIRRKINLFVDSFEFEADEADIPFLIALVISIDNILDNKQDDYD